MKTLKAPEGVNTVSFEGQSFQVKHDQTVELPDHALQNLLQFGFTEVTEQSDGEPKQTPNNKRARGHTFNKE